LLERKIIILFFFLRIFLVLLPSFVSYFVLQAFGHILCCFLPDFIHAWMECKRDWNFVWLKDGMMLFKCTRNSSAFNLLIDFFTFDHIFKPSTYSRSRFFGKKRFGNSLWWNLYDCQRTFFRPGFWTFRMQLFAWRFTTKRVLLRCSRFMFHLFASYIRFTTIYFFLYIVKVVYFVFRRDIPLGTAVQTYKVNLHEWNLSRATQVTFDTLFKENLET